MRPDTSKIARTPNVDASVARDVETASVADALSSMIRVAFDAAFSDRDAERDAEQDHVVLAVSGGLDSTALLHLAVAWRRQRLAAEPASRTPTFSVVTVDHGLRVGSTQEAQSVARIAAELGLHHTTLTWTGPKPSTGIQAAARQARYALLREHLIAHGYATVATAHTADDQAETLLMRLARGSGIDGLGAMRTVTKLDRGAMILRPLLGVGKSQLAAYLRGLDTGWCEDPSNALPKFERVRVRAALEAMRRAGFALDAAALSRTANRAARAGDALDYLTAKAWDARGDAADFSRFGHATVDWAWLLSHPEEIRLRLLAGLVEGIGGQAEPVSLGQLENLTAGWGITSGATLHGTQWVSGSKGELQIFRETARATGSIDITPGTRVTWDRRFVLQAGPEAPSGTVAALGAAGLAAIEARGWERPKVPAHALWTQPAFRVRSTVLAVPTFGYVDPDRQPLLRSATILPRFAGTSPAAENSAQL